MATEQNIPDTSSLLRPSARSRYRRSLSALMSGTAAAGEFLVDPDQLTQLRSKVGRGFRDHDFEAVLSTDVVDGMAGSPKILAVAVW